MANEGFEDWDADFLEKVIRVEEFAIAATQRKPPPPTKPTQPATSHPPPRVGYAHDAFVTIHSPPREMLQWPETTTLTEYDKGSTVIQAANSGVAVAPVSRSSRSGRDGSESDREISRLKEVLRKRPVFDVQKELESVSKQLRRREQECLELRKEREKKERHANLPKEGKRSKAHCLGNATLDITVPSQECAGVSAGCLDQTALDDKKSLRLGNGSSSYHAKGVQTEVEIDDIPIPSDRETASYDSLSKKVKAIRRSSVDLYSGKYLVSKLFAVCATELQVLFGYRKTTTASKPKQVVHDENFSQVTSLDSDTLIDAKVSTFYSAITKMSNGLVQFEIFYKVLLDLCNVQNEVILYRSLRILHVVLLHFGGCQQISMTRDSCVIEATNDVSAYCGDSIENGCLEYHIADRLHISDTEPSCIEWFSIFQLMHQITTIVTDKPVLYEALAITNVILERYGPSERERYGQPTVFQTVPKFLRREAGFRVQKEAVHLLYLLVNCPEVLASLYSGFKERMPSPMSDNDVSAFEELSSIFAGLEDCLICRATVLEHSIQALELHRNAITLVSYLVFFGSSGYEVLWSSTMCNKTSFLILILRLLASEIDSQLSNAGGLTDIVTERTLLIREALIFINRVISHPTFSVAALHTLTGSREVANMTFGITSRLSRKGKNIWLDDGLTKQMLENEIPNLARMLYKRVSSYLGDNVSL